MKQSHRYILFGIMVLALVTFLFAILQFASMRESHPGTPAATATNTPAAK